MHSLTKGSLRVFCFVLEWTMVTVFPKWYYLDPLKTIKKVSLKREKKQKKQKKSDEPFRMPEFSLKRSPPM